jgi:hypothetical protein
MLQTNKSELLKKVFCGLAAFNEDLIFRINQDYIHFSLMTKDNTSFILVKISKQCFQKYDFNKIEDIKVSSSLIKQIFSKISKDDIVFISFGDYFESEPQKKEVEESRPSQIQITLSSTKYKKTYQIPIIEISPEDNFRTDEPSLEHELSVKCINKEIIEMLDSLIFTGMKGYGDSITMSTEGNKIDFKEESKFGKSILTLKDFDKIGLKQRVSLKVSNNLLKPLINFQNSLCENSEYFFKKDYPLKVTSKNDDVETMFILAPRVENED